MRLELVGYISAPGNNVNEDYISFSENYGLLLDGSTGLRKEIIPGEKSDARWFVRNFNDIISRDINKEEPLTDIIKGGILEMKEKLRKLSLGDIDKADKPSASIVLIRHIKDSLELFSLGDCNILIETADGSIHKIYDDSVSKLDNAVLEKMVKISREKNISVSSAKEYVNDELINNRYKKNTKDGYWILGFNEEAPNYAYYKKWNLKDIKSFCFFSDGFGDFYETMKLSENYISFYKTLKETDINEMYNRLREKQQEDYDCRIYPRMKSKDDASILFFNVLENDKG